MACGADYQIREIPITGAGPPKNSWQDELIKMYFLAIFEHKSWLLINNNTAYCLHCGFKWNLNEAAQGQVQNVWNIRVQVLFVEKKNIGHFCRLFILKSDFSVL